MCGERGGLSAAWADYRAGRLASVHAVCEERIGEDADDGRAWELLGLVFHASGQHLEAADALERAGLIVPLADEARIALAASYGELRRRRLATELFLELMLRGGLDSTLMLRVAAGFDRLDEPRLAIETCRRIAESDPDHGQVHYDMGYYAARAGYPRHTTDALICRAIDLDPENVTFRIGRITLLIRWDRADEAVAIASRLTDRELDGLTCRCCLERLAGLFRDFGVRDRAQKCESLAKSAVGSHDLGTAGRAVTRSLEPRR